MQKIRNLSSCVEKHPLFAALSDHQYIPALKKKCYVPVWPCNVMFIYYIHCKDQWLQKIPNQFTLIILSDITIATRIFSQILPLVFRKGKCTVILKKIYKADFLQKGKIGNFFPVKNNFLAWNFFHFFSGISFQL